MLCFDLVVTRRSLALGTATLLLGTPTLVRLVGDHGRRWLVLAAVVVPLFVVPLALLLVVHLVARQRRLAIVTAGLLALDLLWTVPYYVGQAPPPGTTVTVMTANLRLGQADADAVVRLVRDQHVDVLATEELTDDAVRRLRAAGLEDLLPHSDLDPAGGAEGCGLWSRFPLTALPPFTARFRSPGARLQLARSTLVVRVLHPFPTVLREGGGEYRRDYADLTRQVRALPGGPTVLAGDLNASTDLEALRTLMGDRFRDAAELSGSGLQRTWSPRVGGLALLQLDHVLVSRGTGARSARVVDLPGSDHRAVVARVVVPNS